MIQLTSHRELRRIAEERMRTRVPDTSLPPCQENSEQIVHELEVHQIELSIQNDELREARFETETALEKYTELYESAPGGYFTLDRSGSIRAVNLAGADLLKIERSMLIGQSFEQFVTEECRYTFTAFLESQFVCGGNGSCEVMLLDNVQLPVSVEIGCIVSSSADECRIALIDISGRRVVEQPFHHENKPHNVSLDRADKMDMELGVCSLREIIDASLNQLHKKSLYGPANINFFLAPEVDERIVADRDMLIQIMFSLLANAVRLTHADGSVSVSALREGTLIKIAVTDCGIGIREKTIPNTFEALADQASIYTRGESSALTLELARQLVELHGGTLWAENLGTGSSFSFTMPLKNCAGIT